jgi:hypothetical protein
MMPSSWHRPLADAPIKVIGEPPPLLEATAL